MNTQERLEIAVLLEKQQANFQDGRVRAALQDALYDLEMSGALMSQDKDFDLNLNRAREAMTSGILTFGDCMNRFQECPSAQNFNVVYAAMLVYQAEFFNRI